MGRITLFTSPDTYSVFVKKELDKRGLPFQEINLAAYPSRRIDLESLTSSSAVPQVFFNTRHVGGINETLEELKKWDKCTRYGSLLERYEAQIGKMPDPKDKRLSLPAENDTRRNSFTSDLYLRERAVLELPDGTLTTVLDITEKLQDALPRGEHRYKDTLYLNAFTGKEAVDAFQKHLNLSRKGAVALGRGLQNANVLHHVYPSISNKYDFQDSADEIFRLQCFKSPDVLNSYRIWDEPVLHDEFKLVSDMDRMLTVMELSSMDNEGKFDYLALAESDFLPAFEEATCQLQKIEFKDMEEAEKKAFCINVYRLMMRYAFVKVGSFTSAADKKSFLRQVKFNIGGRLYSLQEWVDGILRCNRKSSAMSRAPFGRLDSRRRKYPLSDLDNRIHFALNVGPAFASTGSLPFSQFTPTNVDEELDIAARIFCDDDSNVSISVETGKVRLGHVFSRYRSDFAKSDKGLLESISANLTGYKALNMRKVMSSRSGKVVFDDMKLGNSAANSPVYDAHAAKTEFKGLIARVTHRFQAPKNPENERSRMITLRELNLLDTLPDERFDRITRKVQEEFEAPVVLVSLMDDERNWMKSSQWVFPGECPKESPREISFCGHAISTCTDDIFMIPNTLEDDRFADNPLVTGPLGVRFYAGFPIRVPSFDGSVPSFDGSEPVTLGTLCIFDVKPRDLSDTQVDKLREYGSLVRKEIVRQGRPGTYVTKAGNSAHHGLQSVTTSRSGVLSNRIKPTLRSLFFV